MSLYSMLSGHLGSSRLQTILFLLRLLMLLLIIGAMPSCGKDSWIKETKPETEESETQDVKAVSDSDPASEGGEGEDERVFDETKLLVQRLRVFPR